MLDLSAFKAWKLERERLLNSEYGPFHCYASATSSWTLAGGDVSSYTGGFSYGMRCVGDDGGFVVLRQLRT